MMGAEDGVVTIENGIYTLRMERYLPHPVEKVWEALIDSEQRSAWLCVGPAPLEAGATFTWHWDNTGDELHSRVISVDPPRRFEFLWEPYEEGESIVRFELAPESTGVRLKLTHTFPHARELPGTASGWHAHFELLERFLNGRPSPWNWSRWRELKAHYIEVLAQRGLVLEEISPDPDAAEKIAEGR